MADNTYTSTVTLPEGAVPQHSVQVVAYFDEQGATRYVVGMQGAASLAAILGLLELAKMTAVAASEEW